MKLSSIHILHGFKTALAVIITYGITLAFDLEFGYWGVISSVIVMQVYVADSIEMCLYRLSGTIIGALLGAGVMLIIPASPLWTASALFVTTGVCAFLTRYKTRYRMAAITVVIIIMTGTPGPDIILFSAYRVIEIGLGIVCAFGVSVLVFPKRKADLLKTQLAAQAKDCDRLCQTLVDAFIHGQQHVDETFMENLVDQVRKNQTFFLNVHRHEARIYKLGNTFQARVFLMGRCVENLRTMVRILNGLEGKGHEIIMAGELKKTAILASQTLVALNTHGEKCSTQPLALMIDDLDKRLADIRNEGLTTRFDLNRLIQVFSFYNAIKYYAQDILAGASRIFHDN